jgi:CBS-domain-containing membrane protein
MSHLAAGATLGAQRLLGSSTMLTTAQLMTGDPATIRADLTVERAAQEMEVAGVGHLPVVDEWGCLVGMVERLDLARAAGPSRVADVMRSDVMAIAPNTSAREAACLLLRSDMECVPVTDHLGRVVGVVTEGDFVRLAYVMLGGRVPAEQLDLEEVEANRV